MICQFCLSLAGKNCFASSHWSVWCSDTMNLQARVLLLSVTHRSEYHLHSCGRTQYSFILVGLMEACTDPRSQDWPLRNPTGHGHLDWDTVTNFNKVSPCDRTWTSFKQFPTQSSNLCNKMAGSTVSKAALIFSRTLPASVFRWISVVTLIRAVSVLWWGLKPDWEVSKTLFGQEKVSQLLIYKVNFRSSPSVALPYSNKGRWEAMASLNLFTVLSDKHLL